MTSRREPARVGLCCRHVAELVTEALEEALPDRARAEFDEHLGRCDACRAFVRQTEQTIAILRALPLAREALATVGR